MYVMPCPHTWVFPFPRGQLERVEALHYQSQIEFFSCLLPSINVVQVKPGYRKEAPRCSWEVVCQITRNRELREGLAEHIHQIVESNKCINSVIQSITFYDSENFSVMYVITCNCEKADF